MYPGKKACVSIKINGEKIRKQKMLLLHRLKESHIEPKKSNPYLTPLRMDFFGAAHGCGGGRRFPVLIIYHTCPKTMKLDTVTNYLKKIQKLYQSRKTPLEFC